MKNYLVVVYKVSEKLSVEVEASNEEEARKEALDRCNKLIFGKSDCKYIAFCYD